MQIICAIGFGPMSRMKQIYRGPARNLSETNEEQICLNTVMLAAA